MTSTQARLSAIRFSSRCCFSLLLASLSLIGVTTPGAVAADATAAGTITGGVTNQTTGNGLEGATVAIPKLGLTTLVDITGRFVLTAVPAGAHELTVTYSGLDAQKSVVNVSAGQRAVRDFQLTSGIYMLDTFKVSGEKEGYAAALTAQRNADNVKNVVSMDAFGNLPNLNATELAMRLPGVTFGDPGEEVVEGLSIRGQGMGLNTITIDGGQMASFSGMSRQTRMTAFSGTMFESLELIKGQTPDQGADSMGGRINFRTRSPLSMRENHRTSYNFSVVHAAEFTEQFPLRYAHRSHPLFNLAHMQKFRIFGSDAANLAVSINATYSENVFGYYQTDRDFQQTNTGPAFLWDYRTTDNFNNRKQLNLNTKFDYRVSPNSMLSFSVIFTNAPEPARRRYSNRFTTGSQTTVPNATSGIMPGWTDRITAVRAVPAAANAAIGAATATITQTSELISRDQRLRHLTLKGEHNYDGLALDWTADFSRVRYRTLGPEANLQMRIGAVPNVGPNGLPGSGSNTLRGPNGESGVGWIIDRTKSDLYPTVIQNGGLDFNNPDNYRPIVNGLTSNSGNLDIEMIKDLRGNAVYKLPLKSDKAVISLKTGFDVRDHLTSNVNTGVHRWSYISAAPLPSDPSIIFWDNLKDSRKIPVWDPAPFIQNGAPTNPALWAEDRYFNEQNKYTGYRRIQEKVYAGYLMSQGKIATIGFLGGYRVERTTTNAEQFIVSKVATATALRLSDPVAAAKADYAANYRVTEGTYLKATPSVHLHRNFTPNLKGRMSWSTGFGRPSMNNSLPTETINDAAQTIAIGNPALKPQSSQNWDLTVEYYFEPSGALTVGWFHKATKDYIVSNIAADTVLEGLNNGYNGQYVGYTELTTSNAGSAISAGWEFAYSQQLSFLRHPLLKQLRFNANLTLLDRHGLFAGTTYLKREDISGTIPRTGNVSLSWSYKRFGTRILYNYTALNIRGNYSFTTPSRNIYMRPRETVNLGLGYQVRPDLKVSLDIQNLFNEPQQYYRGFPDQLQQQRIQPTKITMGMQGQF